MSEREDEDASEDEGAHSQAEGDASSAGDDKREGGETRSGDAEAKAGEGEGEQTRAGRKRTSSAELAALVPKVSNPSEPSGSSLFDAGWDSMLGDKPGAAQASKLDELTKPTTKPKTSTVTDAVAGEFASPDPALRAAQEAIAEAAAKARDAALDVDASAEDKRDPGEITQDDDLADKPTSQDDGDAKGRDGASAASGASKSADEDDADSEGSADDAGADDGGDADEDDEASADDDDSGDEDADSDDGDREDRSDDDDDESPAAAGADADSGGRDDEGRGGSMGLLLVLGAAAAVVLVLVFLNSSNNADDGKTAKPQPTVDRKRGVAGEVKPRPHPPSEARTRNADRPMRPPEAATPETATETGDAAGQGETGETGGDPSEVEAGTETGGAEAPEPGSPEIEAVDGKREVEDPRDPSLIPPGTPDANAKAFLRLPVSLSDGAPLGGIGRSGIHVDDVSMGAGKDNLRCDDPTQQFSVETSDYINVCFRAVHSRQDDHVRVIWEKDGEVTRRGKLKIPERMHAYKTRAYLRVRPEYVGSWRVRIVPEGEDEIDLVVAEFEISG